MNKHEQSGFGGGGRPWRTRLRWIAAVPVAAALLVVAAAVLAAALTGPVGLSLGVVCGLGSIVLAGRTLRALRRACTAVHKPLSQLLQLGSDPGDEALGWEEAPAGVDSLEAKLSVRVFGLIPLLPDDRVRELIAGLRADARGCPPVMSGRCRRALSDLRDGSERWIDILA